jgi:DNA-directed RNA polymerase specialized sigma24 family protein
MTDGQTLAERFEGERTRLLAVGYRMLGSLSGAEDAVQEVWLRLDRAEPSEIENLSGWLTVVMSRICLDMIRSREARPDEPVGVRLPDPLVSRMDQPDPEYHVMVSDALGLALQVARQGDFHGLLETLDPECVLRADAGPLTPKLSQIVRGADDVARQAVRFSSRAQVVEHVLVNGAAGILVAQGARLMSLIAFTVAEGRVVAMDILADRERLQGLRWGSSGL